MCAENLKPASEANQSWVIGHRQQRSMTFQSQNREKQFDRQKQKGEGDDETPRFDRRRHQEDAYDYPSCVPITETILAVSEEDLLSS
jgi:hypothetical protein